MPRQADHQERRREIIEALWRVTERDGLTGVSFREVAAEAAVSVRRVQYYFGSKAQLLFAALLLLGERIVERGMAGMRASGPDPSPDALLRAALIGAQPIDEESRTYLVLFFCFYIAALTDPALSGAVLSSQQWIHPFMADLIGKAQQRGETRDGIDPEKEAVLLLATNTGLSLGVLSGLLSPDQAIGTIDYRLAHIFRRAVRTPDEPPSRRS